LIFLGLILARRLAIGVLTPDFLSFLLVGIGEWHDMIPPTAGEAFYLGSWLLADDFNGLHNNIRGREKIELDH